MNTVSLSTNTAGPVADSRDMDAEIGAAIRAQRASKGMTLREVAARAGISVGMVSQLERGLTSPSLKILREICAVIELPMSRLFQASEEPADEIVVRATQRSRLALGDKGMRKELLTRRHGSGLQAMLVTIEPGGGSGEDPYSHDGEEVGHVMSGQLSISIGTRHYLLNEGDTFCFESTLPHKFDNPGSVDAVVMWVVSKPFY